METISINIFCELQGCDKFNTFALTKKFQESEEKTYPEWHEEISKEFSIGPLKDFSVTAEEAVEVKTTADSSSQAGDDDFEEEDLPIKKKPVVKKQTGVK